VSEQPLEIDITTLRLDQPGIRVALGDLESEIMDRVWQRPPGETVTVRAVWEEIYPTRPIMYTTVMNTMTRLAKKGLLHAEKARQAFAYRATVSREAFVDRFVGDALERLLVNFGGATRVHLERIADPALQQRLERVLGDIERRRALEEQPD
jgi:predicted transcriptional regulator